MTPVTMLLAEVQNDIEDAFDNFEHAIKQSDVKVFRATSLEDVRKTLSTIEREREHKGRLVNLRRVERLLDTLNVLADNVQAIFPDVSSLFYLWAPIQCLLQIADQSDSSFKKLLNAYSNLNSQLLVVITSYTSSSRTQNVSSLLAYALIDVLEFHQETYAIFRRGGWLMLFDSAWTLCISKLDNILFRLKRYWEVSKQLLTDDEWIDFRHERENLVDQQKDEQTERQQKQLQSCSLWLGAGPQEQAQESLFDRRNEARQNGTCDWILKHPKFLSWLDPDHKRSFLWMKGKPGSGKTTLVTFIFRHAEFPRHSVPLYCLCSREAFEESEDPVPYLHRFLITQILRRDPSLAALVYEDCVRKAESPSQRIMSSVLKKLLLCLPFTYLIIDGLDECDPQQQEEILAKLDFLLQFRKEEEPSQLKILVCSRETRNTPARLKSEPTICLTKEEYNVSKDIHTYAINHIKELHQKFSKNIVDEITSDIVSKAGGMFLWVKLIISLLLSQHSRHSLQTTWKHLPSSLTGVYLAIMRKIEETPDERAKQHVRAIFTWVTFSRRPLKTWELCDALIFDDKHQTLTQNTMLNKQVLDLCKPLIEEHQNGTVAFVHFSVHEFLLHRASGPYLEVWKAERAITASCFRYLLTCKTFFQPSASAQSFASIVQGLHGLFPYVNEFWSSHLASCFTNKAPSETQSIGHEYGDLVVHNGAVIQGNQYFINMGNQATHSFDPDLAIEELGLPRMTTHVTQLPRSQHESLHWLQSSIINQESTLSHRTEYSQALVGIHQHNQHDHDLVPCDKSHQGSVIQNGVASVDRSVLDQIIETADMAWNLLSQATEGSESSDVKDDGISKAFSVYQKQFENLIEKKCHFTISEMGISEKELEDFHLRYAAAPYLCRWKGCDRSNLGFASQSDREKHENLHSRQFCCLEFDCDFSQNGFPSQAALRAHVRRYHLQNKDVPIPSFRSRRGQKSNVAGQSGNIYKDQGSDARYAEPIATSSLFENFVINNEFTYDQDFHEFLNSHPRQGNQSPVTPAPTPKSVNYSTSPTSKSAYPPMKVLPDQSEVVHRSADTWADHASRPSGNLLSYQQQQTRRHVGNQSNSFNTLSQERERLALSPFHQASRDSSSSGSPPTPQYNYDFNSSLSTIDTSMAQNVQSPSNTYISPSPLVAGDHNPPPSFDWFFDHFAIAAKLSSTLSSTEPIFYFLHSIWIKLTPDLRSMLQRRDNVESSIFQENFRFIDGFDFDERRVLMYGIRIYNRFCDGVLPVMSRQPFLSQWSKGKWEHHFHHLWQVLQEGEQQAVFELNTTWVVPARLSSIIEGSDPAYLNFSFQDRFAFLRLVTLGYYMQLNGDWTVASGQDGDRIRSWIYTRMRTIGPPSGICGDITLVCLVITIDRLMTDEEHLMIRNYLKDNSNVVRSISIDSMVFGLAFCLTEFKFVKENLGHKDEVLALRRFYKWIEPELESRMRSEDISTKVEACHQEWMSLSPKLKEVFAYDGIMPAALRVQRLGDVAFPFHTQLGGALDSTSNSTPIPKETERSWSGVDVRRTSNYWQMAPPEITIDYPPSNRREQ